MGWLRLGTLAIESLSSTILLFAITLYLLSRKEKSGEALFFTGYLGFLFLLLLSYTVRYAVFSAASMATGQISNLIVFGLVCFVQFAYRYGSDIFKREARIVFLLTGVAAAAVWISLFFERGAGRHYDFRAQFFTVSYSPKVSVYLLTSYIWATVVLLRKTVRFSRQEPREESGNIRWFDAVARPRGRLALSARSFAYLGIAYALVSLIYLLFQFGLISQPAYALVFNIASLLICLVIFIVYVNNSSQPMSVMVKLVGIPLAVIMVGFGMASNILMPLVHSTLADRYRDDVSLAQLVLDSGEPGRVPQSIAFMLPEGNDLRKLAYLADDIESGWADILASKNDRWQEGLIPEKDGLKPSFIYLDLYNTGSFFFVYEIDSRGTPYFIGFRYNRYRLEVHRFAVRLLLAVMAITIMVLLVFPVAYRRALLKPIEKLLLAVRQVSSGNYSVRLPVATEDEIGQLARGYNDMAVSLENAEGSFKALAENANDGILILSTEDRILFANRRAVEVSGYPHQKMTGMPFSSLLPPDAAAVWRQEVDATAVETAVVETAVVDTASAGARGPNQTGTRISVRHTRETQMLKADRSAVPVEITAADTVWQGDPARVVVIRDITERKQAAEAIQAQQQQLMRSDKLASIGALVAGMAHEINNPNQAISMNFRFFREGLPVLFSLAESEEKADDSVRIAGILFREFKDTAAAAIDEIEASTQRIDHIVKELKRFVQGSASTRYEPTDVNNVVRVVADLSHHLINQATNNFSLELTSDLPPIHADRIGLEQVVLNLLQNACHALENRDQAVTVRTGRDENTLVIEVIDTGRGIPEKDLPNVAATFFTTKAETGGTGLGLVVSSGIIK